MKVLHVIPAVAPRYGGPSSSLASMCAALAGRGVDVMVATTDADGPRRLDVPLGTVVPWAGVGTVFFRRAFSEAFKYSPDLASWLRHHVRDYSVVHIHALLSHASLAAAAQCRREGVPYVIRPLGTLDPWSLGQKRLKKRLLLSLTAGRLLRDAAAIHYTSAEEQRGAEHALGLSRGVVIPLGVDASLLAADPIPVQDRDRDRYVLVLSRLHPVKNLEALIEAFVDLSTEGPGREWRLVVAGDGDASYRKTLEDLAARRQAATRVSFAGWVEGDAKRQLVQRASLFALPSLHENFGVSLVEAMAAGVPVLVTDQVHLSSLIKDAGAGWVTHVDRPSIAHALGEAFAAASERARRGAAARRAAQQFAWPAVAAQLVDLYGRLQQHHAPVASRAGAGSTAVPSAGVRS